ncbi:MAG: M15 family metallopeptidase [Bacteroidaceae bacterium]|nr:M15 family metallopeptidase [Bacteroidaceae bacterium]
MFLHHLAQQIHLRTPLLFLLCALTVQVQAQLSPTEQRMADQGLVNIKDIDPTIQVSLMYSRPDNFTKRVLYTDLRQAFLLPKTAQALKKAQSLLKKEHPEWSLIIFDATRPMSVQQIMWNIVSGTSKSIYVSNPANGGGLHNYGLAVDISICNEKGDTITMGTKIDYMGKAAHITEEEQLLKEGRLTATAVRNRRLLRKVMTEAGFIALPTEWWHFNLVSRATAKREYKVIR